jgi:hypothetical protein
MMKKMLVLAVIAGFAFTMTGCASTGGAPEASPPARASNGVPQFASPPAGASNDVPQLASPPARILNGVPQFVNDAWLQASEDVLIGVGTYKIGNDPAKISTGKPFAETRARADISRQLQTIIKNMMLDYTAQSELDPQAALSFQESITQSLSKNEIRGAKVVQAQTDQNGILWVVMEYSKSAARSDDSVNQAVAAAKLAVPAAAAFDALTRMENAFDKAAGGGPVPVGD